MGKRVRWSGAFSDSSTYSGDPGIEISMDPNESMVDIVVIVEAGQELKIQKLKKRGKNVTFVGTLSEWGTVFPFVTLKAGKILTSQELAREAVHEQAVQTAAVAKAKAEADQAAEEERKESRKLPTRKQAEEEAKQTKRNNAANSKLTMAKKNLNVSSKAEKAKKMLQEVINDYPETDAAATAAKLLKRSTPKD